MRKKIFIIIGFFLGFFLLAHQEVKALMIMDGYNYTISKPRPRIIIPFRDPYTPPINTPKRDPDNTRPDFEDKESRPQYWEKPPELQTSTQETWVPNDKLKEYCLANRGCSKEQILAYFIKTLEFKIGEVVVKEGDPAYGYAGTQGNEYISGGSQSGIAGFYQADNGGWYPISVPPPPRNPNEPFSRTPQNPAIPSEALLLVATLTPTPTPYPGPWAKLKDASYASRYRLQSYIPAAPLAYDADDTTQPYFIIGDNGLTTSKNIAINGLNSGAKVGSHDWRLDNYVNMLPPTFSPSDFELYVRGRKEHKTIDSLSEINSDGIYSLKSNNDLNIDSVPAAFNLYNVVLLAHANVNINVTNGFTPSKSLAIIAPIINFSSQTTDARGIFIANIINTGQTTNQGLKINGNLIAQDVFNIKRRWSNLNRPTIFVVFKPEIYLDLFPYLSVASYNWQQTQ